MNSLKTMQPSISQKRVAAVILAAGKSSRMGAPKQLLEIEGQSLLRRTTQTVVATHFDLVVVVSRQFAAVADLPVVEAAFRFEPDALSDSIKNGLAAIRDWENDSGFLVDAALFVPCDLPLLTSAHLGALLAEYRGETQIVASRFDGVLGTPMLFDRALWPELDALTGDTGGRQIISRHEKNTASVAWEGGQFDLDTPADVEAFRRDFKAETP